MAILGFFGIQTASFAALRGNFAAGVFLQVFRPFSVGDFITAGGVTGTVEDIGIFVTSLLAPDNVRNIVPNAKLVGDAIQNDSVHAFRRPRSYTHTSTHWQVYFDTNRMIVDVLGANGFPVPRIPVAMATPSANEPQAS